jgi:hypothetical protein
VLLIELRLEAEKGDDAKASVKEEPTRFATEQAATVVVEANEEAAVVEVEVEEAGEQSGPRWTKEGVGAVPVWVEE